MNYIKIKGKSYRGDELGQYEKEIDDMIWSFSRCHSFEGCKYEWYMYYLLRDKNGDRIYNSEQNFYASFGKFCHEILEKILTKELNIDDATQYYLDYFDKKIIEYVQDSTRDKYFYLGLEYFQSLSLDWLKDYNILGVEKECSFKIEDIEFTGYIDLLVQNKETKEIIVIDHKSGEYPVGKKGKVLKKKINDYESYKKQLYLYCEQVFSEYGVYPSGIWWNYFRDKQWLKLPFIEEEFKEAKTWAKNLVSEVREEENFLPKMDYFYCNNLCGFRNSCDYKTIGCD